jgi:DNA repair photolyase
MPRRTRVPKKLLLPSHRTEIETVPNQLPEVIRVRRQGRVLHPSPVAQERDVLSLNLLAGCVHRCAFCSIRAHSSYRGNEIVYLYADTAERLANELSAMRTLPRAVLISPATDPFPPNNVVQAAAVEVAGVLAGRGVDCWFMTRGFIRPAVVRRLGELREHLRVIVGLTTLDRVLQRKLEPLTAPPTLRLRQIRHLRELGIDVHVAWSPSFRR